MSYNDGMGALPTIDDIEREVELDAVADEHDPAAVYKDLLAASSARVPPSACVDLPADRRRVASTLAPTADLGVTLSGIDVGYNGPLSRLLGVASTARFNTLVMIEQQLACARTSEPMDYGSLVFAGCQIVEQELRDLLAPCARAASGALLEILAEDHSPRKVLESWFSGRIPATMGVLEILVFTHRRIAERRSLSSDSPLFAVLLPVYVSLLLTRGPEQCLGEIRTRYRNPLAHGECVVGAGEYAHFSLLAVGAHSFRQWDRSGPTDVPDLSHKAVLHHHLWLRDPANSGRDARGAPSARSP
jgi:hypothetical protein